MVGEVVGEVVGEAREVAAGRPVEAQEAGPAEEVAHPPSRELVLLQSSRLAICREEPTSGRIGRTRINATSPEQRVSTC